MDKTQCVHVFEITRSRCLSCGGRNRACGEFLERRYDEKGNAETVPFLRAGAYDHH